MYLFEIKYLTPKKVMELDQLYYVNTEESIQSQISQTGSSINIVDYTDPQERARLVQDNYEFIKYNSSRFCTTLPEAEKLFVEQHFGYTFPLEQFQNTNGFNNYMAQADTDNVTLVAYPDLIKENKKLKSENDELKKALFFYSNFRNFDFNSGKEIRFCNSDDQADVMQKFGTKAKEILHKYSYLKNK